MNIRDMINNIISKIKEMGYSALLNISTSNSASLVYNNAKLSKSSINNDVKLNIKAINDKGRAIEVSADNLSQETIEFLLKSIDENLKYIENEDVNILYMGKEKQLSKELSLNEGELSVLKEKIENIHDYILQKDSRIKSVTGSSVSMNSYSSYIANTEGMEKSVSKNIYTAYLGLFVQDNKDEIVLYDFCYSSKLEDLDIEFIADRISKKALDMLYGKSIASGNYKCIIQNDIMCELLHKYSGIFSSENAQNGLSQFKDSEGKPVASKVVNLIDDSLNVEDIFKKEFDDEGHPCQRTELIKDGMLNTLLYNLKTSHKIGKKSTGNAYELGSSVKYNYMYFQPGKKSLQELIECCEEVLLINEVEALHSGANEVSGDFSLPAKGFLYKNGKLVQAVKGITISGNYYDLLKRVEEFANDTYVSHYSLASASCLLSSMSIAGDN